jgi:hypothetical protein
VPLAVGTCCPDGVLDLIGSITLGVLGSAEAVGPSARFCAQRRQTGCGTNGRAGRAPAIGASDGGVAAGDTSFDRRLHTDHA